MSLWSNKDSGAITGLVSTTGPTFTVAGTSVATASTYYNVPQLSVTGTPNASGATFTVTKIGSGTAYAGFTIINAAIPANGGYTTSSVIKLSGANLGGQVTTNDLTITLTGLPTATLTGTVGTFTQTGTAVSQNTTYTGVVQKAGGTTTGTGAVFSVARTGGTSYANNTTVTCTTPGTGYAVGDTFVISGSLLGGAALPSTANDMTVTITALPTAFSSELKAGSFVYMGPTTAPTTASATGSTITGTALALGSATGTFSVGMLLTGFGTNPVLPGTYIVSGSGSSWVVSRDHTGVNVTSTTITGTTAVANKYKILKVDSNILATLTSLYEAPTFTGGVITRHTAPTSLSLADARNAVFVSREEAQLAVNKAKGFNGPGWWLHKQYNDASGKPRYKSELLVAISTPESVSFDAPASSGEDLLASDTASVVTLTTSPAAKTTSSGTATFGSELVASASSGTLTYQWQRALAATPTRFVNINGATSATVATPGTQTSANTGDQYRVVLSSTNGAPKVTSAPATLTFGT